MKFKCCENLLHTLNFQDENLMACGFKLFEGYNGETFSMEDYKTAREKVLTILKNGEVPQICETCGALVEREWDESLSLSCIELAHRPKCSICNCIYCVAVGEYGQKKKEYYNKTFKPYDVIPTLISLRDGNVLLPNCEIDINGGEVAEYPRQELQKYIYFALKSNSPMGILSSGVKYSKEIEDALIYADTKLMISVDSGQESTYKKIKRVNAFHNVWKNLKKYIKATQKNPKSKVTIKYIIVPGINDNLIEAKAFIKKCEEVKCKHIAFSIEMNYKKRHYYEKATGSLRETILYFNNCKNIYKDIDFKFTPETYDWFHRQLT